MQVKLHQLSTIDSGYLGYFSQNDSQTCKQVFIAPSAVILHKAVKSILSLVVVGTYLGVNTVHSKASC